MLLSSSSCDNTLSTAALPALKESADLSCYQFPLHLCRQYLAYLSHQHLVHLHFQSLAYLSRQSLVRLLSHQSQHFVPLSHYQLFVHLFRQQLEQISLREFDYVYSRQK